MDKNQVISFIEEQIKSGKISAQEVSDMLLRNGAPVEVPSANTPQPSAIPSVAIKSSWGIVQTLYLIGAIIVMSGVGVLAAQHWDEIGFGGRIIVSLGIAFVAYIMGLFIGRDRSRSTLSQVMFILAAALSPLGCYVLLDQMGVQFTSGNQIMVALALLIVFGGAQFAVRNNVLVIIMVAFGSWAYGSFMTKIFSHGLSSTDWVQWSSIILGAAYLFIAYSYTKMRIARGPDDLKSEKEGRSISGILNALGTIAVLGGAISLGGIWDLIVIVLIFGAFYGSVFLKSRSMLILGALFLVGHVIKLTGKYFVDSLSWPVALIFCGAVVIGVAYGTLRMSKKYFGAQAN